MEHVEKKARGQQGILTLCCKNFDLVKLKFSNIEEAMNVASSIEVLSTIGKTQSYLHCCDLNCYLRYFQLTNLIIDINIYFTILAHGHYM